MSRAQELQKLRQKNNTTTVRREFRKVENLQTVDDYYGNILSDEDIENAIAEYQYNLSQVHESFSEKTKLQGNDMGFLFFATMMQCLRIYILNPMLDKATEVEKANSHGGKEDKLHELQDKIFGKFNAQGTPVTGELHASLEAIIATRGVPYDATRYSGNNLGLFKGANHRFATLGHDPLLGLVFGTANILTNTITCVEEKRIINLPSTYHVIYDSNLKNPQIGMQVSTAMMLKAAAERIGEDNQAVAAAIIKQLIHIATDLYTPAGISLPGANLILSKANTEKLTQYISTGDVLKVGASAGVSVLINTLIAAIHGCKLLFDDDSNMAMDLYAIRTRKIILFSNIMASYSNIIATCLGKANLDMGGLIVTCYRAFSDTRFIDKIKYEFLNSEMSSIYEEKAKELDIYYS